MISTSMTLTTTGKVNTTRETTTDNRLSQLQANKATTALSGRTEITTEIILFFIFSHASAGRHGSDPTHRHTDDSKESSDA
jgi:hypothetical protein